MLDQQRTASVWASKHLERGATVLISLRWRADAKQWIATASVHDGSSVRVQTQVIDCTSGIDLPEAVRLLGAIQRECESWLW